MLKDMKLKGYTKAVPGVELEEIRNQEKEYKHAGNCLPAEGKV